MPKYHPIPVHAQSAEQKLLALQEREERAKKRAERSKESEKASASASLIVKSPSKVRFAASDLSITSDELYETNAETPSDIDEEIFQ